VKRRRNIFTLVEVVAAMAILTLGLAGFFSMSFMAQKRLLKAQMKWERFHMLSEAAEYMLLQGMEDPELPSEEFWDYPGYKIVCSYEDVEDLPEEFSGLSGQAVLKCMVLELVDTATEEVVDTLRIDRIDYDDTSEAS
jgi:hypothetical protein